MQDFCQEAVVWRNVHHKNCLLFYGVANVDDDGIPRTRLVSPWTANGNLNAYLSRNPDVPRLPLVRPIDKETRDVTDLDHDRLLHIASGQEYLHAMQPTIVHGDLKSLNIFATVSKRACLADFGLATVHDGQVSATTTTTVQGVYGTAGYMAPELVPLCEDPNEALLLAQLDRRRCDMFALGCVAYEVYTGGPPFHGNLPTVRNQALLSGHRPHRPTDARALRLELEDDDTWLFIESLWAQRPEVRLVAASARDFLRYKVSLAGLGSSEPSGTGVGDPDPGFLSGMVVARDVFGL